MDTQLLDTFLVVGLCLIGISSLIFIIYLVPVLIQLTKTLEAVKELLHTVQNYVGGISTELDKMLGTFQKAALGFGSGFGKTSSQVGGILLILKEWVQDILNKK